LYFSLFHTTKQINLSQFKNYVDGALVAFPDLHFTINDQITSGEKVSTRWTATGTNTGPFGEMQATGRGIEIEDLLLTK
jgi:predicted ester cyclase